LAARKAAAETKPEPQTTTPAATPAAAAPAAEKPLSAAEERAKALGEGREALEAKKQSPAAAAPKAAEVKPAEPEGDKPLSLKERRALLAEKKGLLGK